MKWMLVCISVSLCSISLAVRPPEIIHSVQLKSFSGQGAREDATSFAQKVQGSGWSPIRVMELSDSTSSSVKVWFGAFSSYPDADWWKRALQRRGYADAFIVSRANHEVAEATAPNGPLTPNFARVQSFSEDKNDPTISCGGELDARLQQELQQLFSEEPEKLATDTTETKQLITVLEPLANATLAVSKIAACRARIAIAHAMHYGQLRWLTAYHAYGEALELADVGSAEHAECLLQRAALLMELSRCGKGDLSEVRRMCELIAETVDPKYQRVRAVAALMHAEALFNESRYDEAIAEFLAISDNYPQRPREIMAAQVYAGIASALQGKDSEARDLLEQVTRAKYGARDFFHWRGKVQDPALDAAKWLVYLGQKNSDTSATMKWQKFHEQLQREYGSQLIDRQRAR